MRAAPISVVINLKTGELTATYRHAVATALPAGIDPADIWPDLAKAITDYYGLTQHYRPTKLDVKRWRKVAARVEMLDKELSAMQTPERTLQGDLVVRALFQLCPIRELAEYHVGGYESLYGAFPRRQNPYQQFLYGAVLDIWRWRIGRPLSYSRVDDESKSSHGMPRGPLVKFFEACVVPVLSDQAPKTSTVADIIDRERDMVLKSKKKI